MSREVEHHDIAGTSITDEYRCFQRRIDERRASIDRRPVPVQDLEAGIDGIPMARTAPGPARRNKDVSRLDHAVYFDWPAIGSADNDGLLEGLVRFAHS